MIEGVSCIYCEKCPDVGLSCASCEYYDDGNYARIAYTEYLRCIVEAQLEYLEMINDYADGNDEVIV